VSKKEDFVSILFSFYPSPQSSYINLSGENYYYLQILNLILQQKFGFILPKTMLKNKVIMCIHVEKSV